VRKLLPAAVLLLGLATVLLVWRVRANIDAAKASAARMNDSPPVRSAPGDLAEPTSIPTSRGRRADAAPLPTSKAADSRETAPDGIGILLLDPEGAPMPGIPLDVIWLADGGEFHLEETTDGDGMLATDIEDPLRIEGVVFGEELHGTTLAAYGPFESPPDRPRTVVLRVPSLARLVGTVRDELGRAVARAHVEVEPVSVLGLEPFVGSFTPAKCETDAGDDGTFSLAMPACCAAITAAAEGHDASENALACLEAGAPTKVDLVLQSSDRELRVEVRAPGAPIDRPQLVTAIRAGDPTAGEPLEIQRGADRVGPSEYLVRISRDGDWRILVTPGDGLENASVPVGPQDERIVVALRSRQPDPHLLVVRGTITTDGGAPLSANIAVLRGPDFEWGSTGRSNDSGRFEIEIDPASAEDLFLLAGEPGYGMTGVGPFGTARLEAPFDLVLRPEKSISGTIVGPDGAALAARVSIHPSKEIFAPVSSPGADASKGFYDTTFDPFGFEIGEPQGAEEGAFSFRGLSDGRYEIWATAKDPALRLPPGCAVAEAGAQDVRIVLGSGLERFASIEGVVREAGSGRPIAGARLAAGLARSEGWRSADVRTGADGSYSIPGCPIAALTLYVDASGYAIFRSETRPAAAGIHALDIELLPARTLRVLVVDPTGVPLHGRFISAADAGGKTIVLRDALGNGGDDGMVTDLRGRVDLHGLPAAELSVIVGKREDDGPQPDRQEFRFDLRLGVDSIQRIVLLR